MSDHEELAANTGASMELVVQIEQQLHEEIERNQARLEQSDREMFALRDEQDALDKKADKTGKPEDIEAAEKGHVKLLKAINAGTAISMKLRELRDPAELERRINNKTHTDERIKKMTETAKKTSKPTAKDQGFPAVYLADNGNFKPGYDASAKSDLIAAVLGLDQSKCRHKFTAAEAQKLIEARGWQGFVATKRRIIEEKAAKAKKASEEKAAAAKAKADEKAKAKTEAKPDADANEVTPDPKPAAKPRGRGRKVGA